jgi:SAM-dependent methyltransferase
MARLKTDHLWSSRFSAFERSIHESGGSYPPQLSELISKIEISSILDIVNIDRNYKMLDIGAGGGRWTIELAERVSSVTALEPSDLFELLRARTSKYKNVKCQKQAFEDFILEERFDLVICSGVLVCLKDQELADNLLIKAIMALQKGGYFILREPVARRTKYLLNWVYTDDSFYFEKEFENCEYWEIIRPEHHYVRLCEREGAARLASFPSHAPFFYHINLRDPNITAQMRHILSRQFTLRSFNNIKLYNRLFRWPYGFLRYMLNLRTMKIMIFRRS